MGGSTGGLPGTGDSGGGFAQPMTGQQYNQRLMQGETNEQIRASQAGLFGSGPSDAQWNDVVTQAGMQAPGGRPLPGSAQFYQPVYQPQYQDYNMGNRMGISQYGQQPFFGGGGGGFSGGFGPVMSQMQTPFNFGGQMMGGGYGQFGMNNPFSPYSNSFLNMPSNLNQMGQADKVGFYQNAMGRGFNDQQLYNQASGLFGYQSPQDWSYLQNQAARMPQMQTPFQQPQAPSQDIYNMAPPGGSMDMAYRPSVMTPQQQQAAQQSRQQRDQQMRQMEGAIGNASFGGELGIGNFMRNAMRDQTQQMQPMQPPFRSSGPAQPIVSRSAQARGTPNVMMRRAEGGIASLVDDE